MSLTASGPLSIPMQQLAVLVAASPTFRAQIDAALNVAPGTTTATAALDSIHYPEVTLRPQTEGAPIPARPWAIITDDDLAAWEISNRFVQSGGLLLTFQLLVNPAYIDPEFTVMSAADAELEFRNTVGQIFIEMLQLANTPGPGGIHYWNLVHVTKVTTPLAARQEGESQVFFDGAFLCDWRG